MKNVLKMVLMLYMLVPMSASNLVHAMDVSGKDGAPISIITKASHSGFEKSSAIQAYIDGHTLTVAFAESLGYVQVRITTADGAPLDGMTIYTPSGIVRYIPNVGDYIVTFTLANGDEYYGEFTVTD